jgi:flagellar basal body-associated protein FliL
MILIILSVLVMICTPVVTIFAMKAMISSQTSAGAEHKEQKSVEKNNENIIKGQQCIIANSKGTRYVKLDIAILYTEPGDMDKYFKDRTPENSSGCLNRIKAEINRIIMSKQLDELDSPAGLKSLAEEIKEAIKGAIPKSAKGTIIDVYFPNFLIS